MESKIIESGIQLFSRVSQHSSLDGLNSLMFPKGGPFPNDIIEITSETGVDKTDLLMDFLVKSILPSEYNETWKNCGVVLINTNFQINVFKIMKVLNLHVKNLKVDHAKVKTIIESSLKNLTILDCFTSEEFQITIKNTEKILQEKSNVNLLIVDNLASQYWSEKLTNKMLSLNYYCKSVFEDVVDNVKSLGIVFMFTWPEKVISKNPLSIKVNKKIILRKIHNELFNATVINCEDSSDIEVKFKLKSILYF